MTKRDYAQDTRLSRAMNIARAAGISKAGDGLEDYTGKQWQELVGLVPSYIGTPKAPAGGGPGSAAGQAIELAVGTALAIASPNPQLGIGGSVASNAAMGYGGPNYNRQAGTITSAMASAPPPAKFNIPANIHDFLGFGLDDPNIPIFSSGLTGPAKAAMTRMRFSNLSRARRRRRPVSKALNLRSNGSTPL